MTAAFSLNDVTLGYDRHPAVHHLTGSFATGSLTAVVGPNGSGKSTLLKGLVGASRRSPGTQRAAPRRHCLPAAAGRDRPQFPDLGDRDGATGSLADDRSVPPGHARPAAASRRSAVGDCFGRIVPPNPTTEAVLLAQAMDRDATPDATLGSVFAERVEVTCR